VFWPAERRWIDTVLVDGESLGVGVAVPGPALIELPHTSVSVAPDARAVRDELGNLILEVTP
jgi:N-methylhydantoinase A